MQKLLPFFFLFLFQNVSAQNFTPGNLVVYRVGTGSSALGSTATAVYLDEYSPSGTLVQSVPLPIAGSGANLPVTASGSATSEGLLNRSADGFYLVATGYGAAPGLAAVATTTASATPRVVAFVDYQKNINSSTALTDFSSGNNPRSAISTDGTNVWITGGAGGIRYTTKGATTSTQISTTVVNLRNANVFNGQLYVSTSSGSAVRIGTVGSGTPVSGPQTIANIPGFPTNTSPYQFQFFDLDAGVPGLDVLYVADDAAGIQKFSLVAGSWTLNGVIGTGADTYRGITGTSNGSSVALFATRKSSELVSLTDASGYNAAPVATPVVLATASTNTAFRGLAFAPVSAVNNLSLAFSVATSVLINPPAISTTLSDATDPLTINGILVDVKDNGASIASADFTLTATSSNVTVVPNNNIYITKADGQATIKISAAAVGYSDVTLTLTKGSFTKTLLINVAASVASNTPANTRFHTASSDASAAIAIDDNFMIVGDDEMNKLFVYNRTTSGLPVTSFDFTSALNLTDFSGGVPREVDVEAAVRSINTSGRIYWLGSMSNGGNSFNARPNRNRLFAVTTSGTGAATAISYAGMYSNLRSDLITWGDANGYNFSASAAAGKDSKLIDGFNVEGLTFAPDNTTAFIAFRAPLVPAANRTKAVIAPIQNFESWFNNGAPVGPPIIAAPIELDLGGRGFRDIVRLSNGTYIILAGNYDDMPATPAVFTWNGNANTAPVLVSSFNVSSLNPEAVMEVKINGTIQPDRLQILSDNGDVVYYGDGIIAKDLSQNNYKKFRSDVVISASGSVLPVLMKSFYVTRNNGGNQLTWELALPVSCDKFLVERSVNGRDFTTIASIAASANIAVYNFSDAFIFAGKIYYRIAAIEPTGKKTYSAIRAINDAQAHPLTVFPNPSSAGIVSITTTITGNKYISIVNAAGSLVAQVNFSGNVADINTSDFAKGTYRLILYSNGKVTASKAMVIQ